MLNLHYLLQYACVLQLYVNSWLHHNAVVVYNIDLHNDQTPLYQQYFIEYFVYLF